MYELGIKNSKECYHVICMWNEKKLNLTNISCAQVIKIDKPYVILEQIKLGYLRLVEDTKDWHVTKDSVICAQGIF